MAHIQPITSENMKAKQPPSRPPIWLENIDGNGKL